jgi:predicted phosphodiesterase
MRKRVLSGFLIVCIVFAASSVTVLFGIFLSNIGKPNLEVWNKTDTFTLDYTVQLQKEPDTEFVILNFADVQVFEFQNTAIIKKQIRDLINYKKPDLITLTGDNSGGYSRTTYREIYRYLDSFGIPWAPVFGNHDGENPFGDSRNKIADFYMSLPNCVFKKGPNNLGTAQNPCIGNYIITIMEGTQIVKTLFMMDSNSYILSGYDFIHTEQIEWYEWGVRGIEALAGEDAESLLFFHIPLRQTEDVYRQYEKTNDTDMIYDDSDTEPKVYRHDGFFPSNTDSGMYAKILELKSTKFIFNGHDHTNNFSLTDQNGITFTYCVKTGNGSYYNADRTGDTFITIKKEGSKVGIEHKILQF